MPFENAVIELPERINHLSLLPSFPILRLTAEGLVVNIKKPKYNFTVTTLTKVLVTLWTKDDLIFIPERYRLQYTFILRVYCWTGARLSAFLTGGFRYGGEFPARRLPVARLTSHATVRGTQPVGPMDVPRLAEFLAHATKAGHSMHGIHLGVKEPHRRQFMHSSYRHC